MTSTAFYKLLEPDENLPLPIKDRKSHTDCQARLLIAPEKETIFGTSQSPSLRIKIEKWGRTRHSQQNRELEVQILLELLQLLTIKDITRDTVEDSCTYEQFDKSKFRPVTPN